MIVYEGSGDLFASRMQTIVCPVNCRGAMGAGLALKFKQRYPGLFVEYWKACESGVLTTRRPFRYVAPNLKQILCVATKDDWRNPSEVEYVKTGLWYIWKYHLQLGITSLAVPHLGCGLGGLDYLTDVQPLMHIALGSMPVEVEILTS